MAKKTKPEPSPEPEPAPPVVTRAALTAFSLFDQTSSSTVKLKPEAQISLAALLVVIVNELVANADAQRTTNPDLLHRVAGQKTYYQNGASVLRGVVLRLNKRFDLYRVVEGEAKARALFENQSSRLKASKSGKTAHADNAEGSDAE